MALGTDFELEIIKPTETTRMTVAWVEVEGIGGSFTVGPDHSPLICILRPGGEIVYSVVDGQVVHREITSGIFSVSHGHALIIFDR